MNLGLEGRVAVVGGASSGLGFAVADHLAAEGADVVIVSRSEERIQAAAERLADRPGRVLGVAGDVVDPEVPAAVVARATECFGAPTILVPNSGGPPSMPAVDIGAEDLTRAHELLLLPVQRLVTACLPGMRNAGWGRIVAITSVAVRQPMPGLGLSNALRAAVTGYLKTLAAEVGGAGITVNTVCPGFTSTERLDDLAAATAERTGTDTASVFESWAEQTAVKRMLQPDELAAAVTFLCSAAASGISGVALAVDGGLDRALL
jgi:3-oxoacyl-[acyl-carrier protein] reductase